ncbi:MAG: DNA polymerase IV [Clostridia bacterium]|nr:DNA polymerase IV [Clostridia bacterium]
MNTRRCILHSDLNNFYASVETLRHPELKGVPLAVTGSVKDRHGVVLAKNMQAKKAGVKTGDVLWQAKQKCPGIVAVPADFPAYLHVSRAVREIYARYTDLIEPFGIDECWLDVTASRNLFGDGETIAQSIRETIKRECGVTVSVGVSWNKIFAKLGSDMKKPDAVTVISPENYRETAWKLPASDLLYVGKATAKKLAFFGISTIGDLACADEGRLVQELGKWGKVLYDYANGLESSPVRASGEACEVKSVGNSLTCYRDLSEEDEIYMLFLLLADSVAGRLAERGLGRARTVKISVTDNDLTHFGKQGKLPVMTRNAKEIADCAMVLFRALSTNGKPVRALGVSVSEFSEVEQLDLFGKSAREEKLERADDAVMKIREKYGNLAIRRATVLQDDRLKELDVKGAHIIHPAGHHEE